MTLDLAPSGAPLPHPLNTTALPPPLPDNDWGSAGPPSCEAAATEEAGCSCEPSSDTPMVDSSNALPDRPSTTGSFPPHLPVELETRSMEFDVDSLPSHSFVELERRTTDHSFRESLDTLNDPMPYQLCQIRPVVSNQTGNALPGTPYYISLDLPPDCKQFFPSRKDEDLPLLTALGPRSKQSTNPPSPPLLAWRGWEKAGRPTQRLRPPRQPPPSLDFSLSANERSHLRPAQPRQGESKPPLRNTPPLVVMKTQWTPRTASRRRLERLRNQPPRLRRRYKHIFSPPLITDHLHENNKSDYPHENKKLEYHITIDSPITDHLEYNKTAVFSPFINLFDSFPEYKTLMYWEVKAG